MVSLLETSKELSIGGKTDNWRVSLTLLLLTSWSYLVFVTWPLGDFILINQGSQTLWKALLFAISVRFLVNLSLSEWVILIYGF